MNWTFHLRSTPRNRLGTCICTLIGWGELDDLKACALRRIMNSHSMNSENEMNFGEIFGRHVRASLEAVF